MISLPTSFRRYFETDEEGEGEGEDDDEEGGYGRGGERGGGGDYQSLSLFDMRPDVDALGFDPPKPGSGRGASGPPSARSNPSTGRSKIEGQGQEEGREEEAAAAQWSAMLRAKRVADHRALMTGKGEEDDGDSDGDGEGDDDEYDDGDDERDVEGEGEGGWDATDPFFVSMALGALGKHS